MYRSWQCIDYTESIYSEGKKKRFTTGSEQRANRSGRPPVVRVIPARFYHFLPSVIFVISTEHFKTAATAKFKCARRDTFSLKAAHSRCVMIRLLCRRLIRTLWCQAVKTMLAQQLTGFCDVGSTLHAHARTHALIQPCGHLYNVLYILRMCSLRNYTQLWRVD